MFLRFYRLAENGVATAVLFLHGARRFLHVLESSGLNRRGVGYHRFGCDVDFHDRTAAGAGHFEI